MSNNNIEWRIIGDTVLLIEEIESLPDMPPLKQVFKIIDRKTFIECFKKWIEKGGCTMINDDTPTKKVDISTDEVVRCKDCKYFKTLDGVSLCKAWDDIFYVDVDENGYCYKAERKDVE